MTRSAAGLVLGISLVAAGCTRTTTVKEVLDDPGHYDNRRVTLEGDVVDSANLLVVKFYKLDDGTGRIAVVTPKAVPRPGAHLRVSGTIHQAFALGSDQLTVLVEPAQ